MQNNTDKSFGYYTIPFAINKYGAFKKHINSIISKSSEAFSLDSTRFEACRYVFSYIKQIYKNNDYFTIDIPSLKSKINCDDVFNNLFPLKDKNKTERFSATLEEISVLIFGKSKGYILFKVDYNNMTLSEIEAFSYFFKHIVNSTKNNSTFAKLCCFILGVKDFEKFTPTKGDFTTPFYYLSFSETYVCDVLQLICRKIGETEDRKGHLICLGRGYGNPKQNTMDGYVENSNYDMSFAPNNTTTWLGSPNTLTCLFEGETLSSGFLPQNIENDYLCLFLTLQNQRHTLLSLMTDMVVFKNKSRKLLCVQEKLNSFKLAESFKTVSNEYSYQNIYELMYNILDIDNLMADISDVSAHAAQQKEKSIENLFKIFTVLASIEPVYNISAVVVPLITGYINNKIPTDFYAQLSTLVGSILLVIGLIILYTVLPKIIKRK